jgi:hypothetical protein
VRRRRQVLVGRVVAEVLVAVAHEVKDLQQVAEAAVYWSRYARK